MGIIKAITRAASPHFHAPDARGAIVPLLDPGEMLSIPEAKKIARKHCSIERFAGWSAICMFAGAIISLNFMTTLYFALSGWFFLVSAVVWCILNRPSAVRARSKRIAREARICASCGYSLGGMPLQAGGFAGHVICPECGSAWSIR